MPDVSKLEAIASTSPSPSPSNPPQSTTTTTTTMSRPSESHSPLPSPGFQTSRPATPSPRTSSNSLHHPITSRRPSSSLSIGSTSRRASMLSPADQGLPQRLPRQPSPQDAAAFAELHQELETEQEAQVNRLLNMIRLQQLHSQNNPAPDDNSSTAATIDSNSTTTGRARSPVSTSSLSRRGSGRLSREGSSRHRSNSRTSTTSSPSIPTGSLIGDNASDASSSIPWLGSSHSDMGFYVAEAQMLARENEMLKRRIRELERQLSEVSSKSSTAGSDVASPP